MRILGLNLSHNASCTIIEDGKIILSIEEERFSRIKKDHNIKQITKFLSNQYFDYIYYTHYNINVHRKEFFKQYVLMQLQACNITFKVLEEYAWHHLTHAFTAFYNSGYEEAIILVVDNGGLALKAKDIELGPEIVSIVKMNYTDQPKELFKICRNEHGKTIKIDNNFYTVNTMSIPGAYDFFAKIYDFKEAGSIMGLSCYGKENYTNKQGIFEIEDKYFITNVPFVYNHVHLNSRTDKEDACYKIQKSSEQLIEYYFKYIKESFPDLPICVSGGFFQNCVANYALLKKGYDFFVDPISHDGGTSIGLAQHFYLKHNPTSKIEKYENLYLGPKLEFDKDFLNSVLFENCKFKIINTNKKRIAELLKNRNAVAIFQGGSEAGPRALGNRSLLFDPSDPMAKEKVNLIKKREWFRPYAGTVLDEYKNKWFNLFSKKSTPYMSFALEILEDKRNIIPGICHIDNTCRAQTLLKKDNEHFYDLIKEFYNLTGIPILLNTSLNKAGSPLVQSLKDLFNFLEETSTQYAYLPEKEILITKEN
jgi:carbamoyltransferase